MSRAGDQGAPGSRRRLPARRGTAATLADVARLAAVSTASVSRALNAPDLVSRDIVEKVRRASAELGYAPHAAARALAAARSRTIGIVVPTIALSIFAGGIEAIEQELEAHGYSLVIATSGYDTARELAQVRRLVARGVDGIILVGLEHDPNLKGALAEAGLPYICQGAYGEAQPHPCCGFDNAKAIRLAVDHLLELGHRRIAILAGIRRDNDRVAERIRGALERLRAAGLEPVGISESGYSISEGRRRAAELLAAEPTAILCINDVLATAAMCEAHSRGIAVPDQISVTGFDDFEFAANMYPSLTTVRVPVDLMGRSAARLLVSALRGEATPLATEIPTELVIRESTAPPSRSSRS